jgi:hypothetical protein
LGGDAATVNHGKPVRSKREKLARLVAGTERGDAEPPSEDEPVTVSRGESVSDTPAVRRSSGPLKNWKHEEFARQVVAGTEPEQSYTLAGFTPNRANHNRLIRQPHMKDRIDVLRRERELAARAARVPIEQVLGELDSRGLIRIEDFFERNAAGIVTVRNLEMVPVEVGIALLRILGEAFGIREK